ncbi:MAG: ABC transporter substrate-binding protein [Proteobacteria bacterium]|nr:ABC transporter substrate-binding protein [Pseudomonadota bacterium]
MVTTRRKLLINAGAGLGLGVLGAGWHTTTRAAPGARKLVMGQSVPLTGAASEIGLAFAAGAKLYVDAFNEKKDAPLELELRQLDDGYDAARAGANAKKLLADGADLLFGFVGTASSTAAANVAKEQGAVLLAPFAAADNLRDGSFPQVFHVRPSMTDEAFKIVQHAATIGHTRIAVLGEDDAMGRAGLAAVEMAMKELKLPPPVASAFVPTNSAKVDAAVATISAQKPQVVIQASLFNTTAAFIRAMRKSGWGGTFMNFSMVGMDPLFVALGKDIRGVVISQVVPSPRSTATPIVREYLAAIDNSDQTPSYESLEGFIAAKTLGEAVRRNGAGLNRASMQKALNSLGELDVGGYRLRLRAGVHDSAWAIDLVTVTADGRVIR